MVKDDNLKLSNGVEIPVVGLGTWLMDNDTAEKAVHDAVAAGYRHIDTAQAYENEEGIGRALKKLDRKSLFVTTKVKAEYKSFDEAYNSIKESLEKLGTDYLDLVLIHSPQPWAEFREGESRFFDENREVWKAFEKAYHEGLVRAIGVSNFLIDDLESLLATAKVKPMVNQVLSHAGNTPLELIDYCQKNGILVEAYSPVGHGAVLRSEELTLIADKYGVSTAQLSLKYDIQLGLVVLPKTANKVHMEDNLKLDFTISDEDMAAMKTLKARDYGEHGFFPVFAKSGN